MTTTVLKTKTREVANKILDNDKYITTPELNKLTTENFASKTQWGGGGEGKGFCPPHPNICFRAAVMFKLGW